MNKKKEKKELVSLNSEFSEFNLQELEQRLETDPLSIGGLLDLISTQDFTQSMAEYEECCHCSWFSHNK